MEDGSEVSDASVEEILNSDEESEKQQPSKTSCDKLKNEGYVDETLPLYSALNISGFLETLSMDSKDSLKLRNIFPKKMQALNE
ncbi:hypothetical protein JTB14_032305 [Gonioctena quinquepunctata]|nr:hypothetical protein JTB14_032305 [Gonioctena quinquepunctata]